jgi:hypothetical protein
MNICLFFLMTKTMSAFGNRAWPVSARINDESSDMKVMAKLRMIIGPVARELVICPRHHKGKRTKKATIVLQ